MNKRQVRKIIEQEKISFILLQFSDFLGQPKNVVVDVERLDDVLENGLWFDGSSIEGFARIAESDMLLKPDLKTVATLPWTEDDRKTLRIICDVFKPSGRKLWADPRQILQKVLAEANKIGFNYYVGAEFEFYLFERSALPALKPHDYRSYFDYAPHSRATTVCEKTMKALRSFGIRGEMHHHEVGQGQHEIDIRYDQALKSADNILSLKMALKAHSTNSELKATWMPKPIVGFPGNGLHVHQSLWKDGKNLFFDPRNKYHLSRLAFQFLAGQLAHARALSAIVSPTVNSYKRLVSGYEAPVYVCWGQNNRSALIRIPRASKNKASQSARLEYRAPDPSSSPYLTFAALLTAGLDGIKQKMTIPQSVEDNVYEFDFRKLEKNQIDLLPESLGEAIKALEKDKLLTDLLGPAKKRYLEIKKEEWRQFLSQVTQWEVKRFL